MKKTAFGPATLDRLTHAFQHNAIRSKAKDRIAKALISAKRYGHEGALRHATGPEQVGHVMDTAGFWVRHGASSKELARKRIAEYKPRGSFSKISSAFFDELEKIGEKVPYRILKQFVSHPGAMKGNPIAGSATKAAPVLRRGPISVPKPSDVGGHAFVPKKALSIPGLTD